MKLRPGAYVPKTDEDWQQLRFEIRELFNPSTPINQQDRFAGRFDKINELSEACVERGRHAVLFGERGVGKTSLANVFHRIISTPTRHIFPTRVQCDPSSTFESVWATALDELTVKNGDGSERVPLSDHRKEHLFPDDIRRLLELFMPNELPIIMIDEFDKATDPELRPLMANTIKNLSDYGSRATIVIVGVADDVHTLIGEHESIKRCLTQVRMPRMSHSELLGIIGPRVDKLGMKITNSAKWKIVVLSRGLPPYTHRLGRHAALAAAKQQKLAITDEHVDQAIDDVLRENEESCRQDYDRAVHSNRDNFYREILLACALVETADNVGFFTPTQVIDPLSQIRKKPIKIADFQSHLKKFSSEERGNILERIGAQRSYKFRFRDPMMQPYVILKGIAAKMVSVNARDVLAQPDQPRLFPTELAPPEPQSSSA